MTRLYASPVFLEHDTGTHPEKGERLSRVTGHLAECGLDQLCVRPPIEPVTIERLSRVHTREYIDEISEFARGHVGYIEADTVVSRRSYDVALLAAGAVCDAVQQVVRGDDRQALCLTRPPGHHALQRSAMGFCLFNHIAAGARVATRELGLDRVLIVDWDVHHGNGTQDLFWTDAPGANSPGK